MKNTPSFDFENIQVMQNIKWFTVTISTLLYHNYVVHAVFIKASLILNCSFAFHCSSIHWIYSEFKHSNLYIEFLKHSIIHCHLSILITHTVLVYMKHSYVENVKILIRDKGKYHIQIPHPTPNKCVKVRKDGNNPRQCLTILK